MRVKCTHNAFTYALFIVISCSQSSCRSQHITKNEYGLKVISSKKAYKSSISTNNSKRLVLVKKYVDQILIYFPYATPNNFTHKVLYQHPFAFVRYDAAIALQKAEEELSSSGIGLKLYDAYRPYNVTKEMWKIVPDSRYAADPTKGSGHNRGAAVDVSLINLNTKEELAMPTAFDDFTEKAHHNYMDLPADVLANRQLLKTTMEKYGFVALDTEWWHYSLPNAAEKYELLDLDFRDLKKVVH